VVNEQFATTKQDVLEDVMAAVLKASKWLDVRANRTKAASVLGVPEYVNATGEFRSKVASPATTSSWLDLGAKTFKDDYMVFLPRGPGERAALGGTRSGSSRQYQTSRPALGPPPTTRSWPTRSCCAMCTRRSPRREKIVRAERRTWRRSR